MPSEQQEPITDSISFDSSVSITPHVSSPSHSEPSLSHGSDPEVPDLSFLSLFEKIEIPREETLKDILEKAAGTNDLSSTTQIKLQVITTDISLQHLNIYMPLLAELNLNGSVVSSLRDLGCGLKNLKILRVCQCKLTSLDGMFSLQNLEELHAQNNKIEDLSPCSWLPLIRILDLKRNCIKDISAVSFLSLCSHLEHLVLDENKALTQIPEYRQIVKSHLSHLKTLDEKDIRLDVHSPELPNKKRLSTKGSELKYATHENSISSTERKLQLPAISQSSRVRPMSSRQTNAIDASMKFTARFPPKVLSPRPSSSGSSTDSSVTTFLRCELPEIHQEQTSAASCLEEDS